MGHMLRKRLLLFIAAVFLIIAGPGTALANSEPDSGFSIEEVYQNGFKGYGFVALSSVFGHTLVTELTGYDPGLSGVDISGPENGLAIAIAGFFSTLAFAIFPIFMTLFGATGALNTLQSGEFLGGDDSGQFVGARWMSGISLAFPMPGLYGLAVGQKLILMAAIGANGIGNTAALSVVDGAYMGALGADVVAGGSALVFDVNPDVTSEARMAYANMLSRKSCAYHARSLGLAVQEVSTVCQGAVSAGSDPVPLTGTSGEFVTSAGCQKVQESSGSGSAAFQLCQVTHNTLKELEFQVEDALALPSETERVAALEAAQGVYWQRLRDLRTDFDEKLSLVSGGDETDPMQHVRTLVEQGGWPALGLVYMKISSQVDGMKAAVQQGEEEFDFSQLPSLSRVGKELRYKMAGTLAESEAAEIFQEANGTFGAGIVEEPKGFFGSVIESLMDNAMFAQNYAEQTVINAVVDGASYTASAEGQYLADFFSSGSALEGVYDFSSKLIGAVIGVSVFASLADFLGDFVPAGRFASASDKLTGFLGDARGGTDGVLGRVAHSRGQTVQSVRSAAGERYSIVDSFSSKLKSAFGAGGSSGFGEGEGLISWALTSFLTVLVFLILTTSFINVAILPKLPALYTTILVLDWVVTTFVIVVGAPLWIILQLTSQQGKTLMTNPFQQGVRVVSWVFLFPVFVVAGIAISATIVNAAIPMIAMVVLSTTTDGITADILSIFSMPLLLLFSVTLTIWLCMSLIIYIPNQFAQLIGVNPVQGKMIDQAMGFLGGQSHIAAVNERTSSTHIIK